MCYKHCAASGVSVGPESQGGLTWLDTGLCLRPGLFSSSSSCLRLKLETPRDLTSPASLQASKACRAGKIHILSKTDRDYLFRLTEIVEKNIKHTV